MGNINKLWFEKDSGNDWKHSKCQLDDAGGLHQFMIPFIADTDSDYYMQLRLLPGEYDGYVPCHIYACNLDYSRITNDDFMVAYAANWSIGTTDEGSRLLTFRVPQDWGACTDSSCWRWEVVLCKADNPSISLFSEPYYCSDECATTTLLINSDYCGKSWDVFGPDAGFVFDIRAYSDDVSGVLRNPVNTMRIPAVLRQLPSKFNFSRNDKCNNYRSEVTEVYSLKGTMLFPPYFAQLCEGVMAGKKFYIKGDEYSITSDSVFQTLNIQGMSALKLDVQLQKCAQRSYFDCACPTPPVPPDCPTIVIPMTTLPAPVYNTYENGNKYGKDRSIFRTVIDPTVLAPLSYVISNWIHSGNTNCQEISGTVPGLEYHLFDDSAPDQYWQRNTGDDNYDVEEGRTQFYTKVNVLDSNGCLRQPDLGIDMAIITPGGWTDYESCANAGASLLGYFADFDVYEIGSNHIKIAIVNPQPGCHYHYCVDEIFWQITGDTTGDATINSLSANTIYAVYVGISDRVSPNISMMGPFYIKTTP